MMKKIIAVLLLCVLLLCGCNNQREGENEVMIQGDGQSISMLDYQIYYFIEVNRVLNSYSSTAQIGLDLTSDLSTQTCSFAENMSWAEYFGTAALRTAQEILSCVISAQQEGFTLTSGQQDSINETVNQIDADASSSDLSVSDFLRQMYGPGVTKDDMRRIYERYTLYTAYTQAKEASLEFSTEEMDAYYGAHKDDIDTLTVRVAPYSYSAGDEASKEKALQTAQRVMEKAVDEESFVRAFTTSMTEDQMLYYSGTDISKTYNIGRSAFGTDTEAADYMFDDARVYGDKRIVDTGSSYLVMFFIEKDTKDYNTCDVRVIVAAGSTPSDRKAEAERLRAELREAGDTEAKFIELANSSSADASADKDSGGLYSGVYKGKGNTEVTDWCFDPARKYGDIDIVTGYTGRGAGYSLMFYSGQGENYRTVLVKDALAKEYMANWVGELLTRYHIESDTSRRDSIAEKVVAVYSE